MVDHKKLHDARLPYPNATESCSGQTNQNTNDGLTEGG